MYYNFHIIHELHIAQLRFEWWSDCPVMKAYPPDAVPQVCENVLLLLLMMSRCQPSNSHCHLVMWVKHSEGYINAVYLHLVSMRLLQEYELNSTS